jgi:hypothetical protein
MAFHRIVKRGERYYKYAEFRWRERGKVRSNSVLLVDEITDRIVALLQSVTPHDKLLYRLLLF